MPFNTLRRLALLLVLVSSSAGCHLFRQAADDGPLAIEMLRIPGGVFMMGDVFGGENEDALPVHTVRVKPFELSKYEVTYDQYDAFAEATGRPLPSDDGRGRGRRAVAGVTWDDARAFCAYRGYRLPTEAEWEYAARSGGRDQLYAGTSNPDSIGAYAFYSENTLGRAMPVGLKRPNALGLHDMSGNVAEWVGAYYEKYPEAGRTPAHKDLEVPGMRVARGGSFMPNSDPLGGTGILRTYWRSGTLNDVSSSGIGIRCAR